MKVMKKAMKEEMKSGMKEECCKPMMHGHMHGHMMHHCKCGALYGLGFVGAAIYYVSASTSFWMGVVGVLKALVWPAFLVYSALKSMGV